MTPPAPRAKANPAQLLTGILSEEEQARSAALIAEFEERRAMSRAEEARYDARRAKDRACRDTREQRVKLVPWLLAGLAVVLGLVAFVMGTYAAWKNVDHHVANAAGVIGLAAGVSLLLAGVFAMISSEM